MHIVVEINPQPYSRECLNMIGEHKLGFTNDDQVRWNNNFEVREREGWKYIFVELEAKLKKHFCYSNNKGHRILQRAQNVCKKPGNKPNNSKICDQSVV